MHVCDLHMKAVNDKVGVWQRPLKKKKKKEGKRSLRVSTSYWAVQARFDDCCEFISHLYTLIHSITEAVMFQVHMFVEFAASS